MNLMIDKIRMIIYAIPSKVYFKAVIYSVRKCLI